MDPQVTVALCADSHSGPQAQRGSEAGRGSHAHWSLGMHGGRGVDRSECQAQRGQLAALGAMPASRALGD